MNTDPGENTTYREIQYYRQRWILLLLMAAAAISWYSFLNLILFKDPGSNNLLPASISILLWVIFGLLIPALLYVTRLVTELVMDELRIQFRPFSNRSIYYSDIKSVNLLDEFPPENRGFLNIQIGHGNPPGFFISEKKGVEILLKNGGKILLGSDNPGGLAKAIRRQMHK
jgi:hypothetical protein